MSILLRSSALAASLLFANLANAAPAKVDVAKSSVSAVFKQMNVPVEGKFKKFNAQIDFNPAKPETAKASIEIDAASFDLGEAEYNQEVAKKEWFDAAHFPKANFVATSMKAAGPGKFDVSGKLSIKGKTADVHFPLSVKQAGTQQVFDGALPIKRLAFNIGEGEWKDTSMVADDVIIKFHIVTAP